ncbi:MAG TPA: class IV adenylate cyclase [Pyrinomonadaceae bacterium]|jgi:adenylate cyclase class 2|nr:class IV adenylate cyclase [Pyrinomonadaceae bacterium]
MPIEIEKKYGLTRERLEPLRLRLKETGAEVVRGEEFEENTIYTGPGLDPRSRVLRLRRVNGRALFTFKERDPSPSAVKRQREEETEVSDADALAAILEALGYRAALVYEKRRATWRLSDAEVVIDELPFGLFLEIEGEEPAILSTEKLLNLEDAEAEHAPYPELTIRHGTKKGELFEARFAA